MKRFIILIAIFFSVNIHADYYGYKQPKDYEFNRGITLDSGYRMLQTSNRAMENFAIDVRDSATIIFDYGDKYMEDPWQRFLYSCVYNTCLYPINHSLMYSHHEFGHATRYRSFGLNASYLNSKFEDIGDNYFSMFGALIKDSFSKRDEDNDIGAATLAWSNWGRGSIEDLSQEAYFNFVTAAGGLNNQSQIAKRWEDEVWYNSGSHIMSYNFFYVYDKSYSSIYSILEKNHEKKYLDQDQIGSDIKIIVEAYQDMNIDVTRDDIILYGILPVFMSSQFWALIIDYYDYMITGDKYTKAPECDGIRFPNTSVYYTTSGITYQFNSGYRLNDHWMFPISIEAVVKGDEGYEISAGARYIGKDFYIHGEGVYNLKKLEYGGTIYSGYKIHKNIEIQAGCTYHNVETFLGERNIPSTQNLTTNIETWFAMKFLL